MQKSQIFITRSQFCLQIRHH